MAALAHVTRNRGWPFRAKNGLQATVDKKLRPPSHSHKELGPTNNHMSLETVLPQSNPRMRLEPPLASASNSLVRLQLGPAKPGYTSWLSNDEIINGRVSQCVACETLLCSNRNLTGNDDSHEVVNATAQVRHQRATAWVANAPRRTTC